MYIFQILEATMGFEPMNGGFANHCVSHFATSPILSFYQIYILILVPRGRLELPRPIRTTDFKSGASTIPPPRPFLQKNINLIIIK